MLGFKEYIREVELSFDRIHPKTGELEDKLNGSTKLDSDEEEVLYRYVGQSSLLNYTLLNYHNNGITPPNNIPSVVGMFNLPALDAATNKRFNRAFTMYSGLGFDPRTQMNKDKRVLMPAFTSGSLNKRTAGDFMKYTDENGFQHILRVNAKHNDHGISMKHIYNEHEIMLPRNTILHIHRSEIDPENPKVMVHHATIDHETDPDDFQKPMKSHLVNDLMNKIKNNKHTNEDIDQASIQGYLTQDHLDELSKQLSQKIKTKSYTTDDLKNAIKHGYIKYIGQDAINAIVNQPNSTEAHKVLAEAHLDGKDIGKTAIDAIANHPNSTEAHKVLAEAHFKGKKIGQTAIDAIANHPNSTEAHRNLVLAHNQGKKIGQKAIDAIANHPNSTEAHGWLAGKDIGQDAINAIAKNSESTWAHNILARKHYEGKEIGQAAIDAIVNHPNSTEAHEKLAMAHEEGKDIGEDNYKKLLRYRS